MNTVYLELYYTCSSCIYSFTSQGENIYKGKKRIHQIKQNEIIQQEINYNIRKKKKKTLYPRILPHGKGMIYILPLFQASHAFDIYKKTSSQLTTLKKVVVASWPAFLSKRGQPLYGPGRTLACPLMEPHASHSCFFFLLLFYVLKKTSLLL